MKLPLLRVAGTVLLPALAVTAVHADYPTTVISQAPAAYYRLNETAPPPPLTITAANSGSVGSAGNGEFRNGVERGATGVIASDSPNFATRMPGIEGNRVRVPWAEAWNPSGPLTVEFWAKPGQTNALACPAASVEFITTPQRNGWLFYQGDTTLTGGNGWIFRHYNNSSLTAQSGAAVTMDLKTDQFYHVVGVFDGSRIKLYVNGSLVANNAFTSTPRPNSNSSIPLTFGARADGVSGYFNYTGTIDEAAIYNAALSDAQILAHYQAGIDPNPTPATPYFQVVKNDSPVGYWRLNEAGDAIAANAGTLGAGANAKIIAPTTVNVAGPTGAGFGTGNKAVQFSTGGYVQAPALNLNTNTVTITCWVKPDGAQAADAGVIFQRARLATGASGTTAGIKMDSTDGLALSYNWDGDGATYSWASGVSLNPGEWNFVALIVQPRQAVLFVPNGPNPEPQTRLGDDNNFNHAPLEFEGNTYIGMDPTTSTTDSARKFVGAIDEVAIFGRALSIGETYSQYAAAVGNLPPKIFVNPTLPVDPVYAGDTVTLTVDAGGTPDLTYQWRRNGSNVPGATGPSITLTAVTLASAGDYTVLVKNAYGQVTSGGATLFINDQATPTFIKNLTVANRTLYAGGSINFSVIAAGGGLTYQWTKDGAPIPGATSPTLSLSGIVAADAGAYGVTVRNPMGVVDSATTTVAIGAPALGSYAAEIATDAPRAWFRLDDPAGSESMLDSMGRFDGFWTNRLGTPVTLGVTGALTGDANTATRFLASDQAWGESFPPAVSMGDYSMECWVRTDDETTETRSPLSSLRNQYGMALFKAGTSWSSGDGYGDLDTTALRSSAVSGSMPGQWMHFVVLYSAGTAHTTYINGVRESGGPWVDHSRNRNVPIRVGAALRPGAEWFWTGEVDEVAFYNKALSADRILAHYQAALYPSTAPFFLREPVTQVVLPSASVTFEAQAEGSYPLTYQWYKNGSAITGATASSYTLTASTTPSGPDEYKVVAKNNLGQVTSRIATLTVLAPNPTLWSATNDLVLHLKFDGNTEDSSGRNNNGTAVGQPTLGAGMLGQALNFNTDKDAGVYNYVTLGSPADFKFGTNVDFSVAYWVHTAPGQTNGDLPFLCSATNSYGNQGITFAPSYNRGGWSFSLNGVAQVYGGDNSINDGNWHHLLHAVNRKGNIVTYLDGVQVDSRSASTSGNLDTTSGLFNVGQDPSGTYAESGSADIDDLAVWRRTLTAYDAYAINYVGRTYGASFDPVIQTDITMTVTLAGGNVAVSWVGGGTLQQADAVVGPWSPVPAATSPYTVAPSGNGKFFRVAR
jgi:hypothetical protein